MAFHNAVCAYKIFCVLSHKFLFDFVCSVCTSRCHPTDWETTFLFSGNPTRTNNDNKSNNGAHVETYKRNKQSSRRTLALYSGGSGFNTGSRPSWLSFILFFPQSYQPNVWWYLQLRWPIPFFRLFWLVENHGCL